MPGGKNWNEKKMVHESGCAGTILKAAAVVLAAAALFFAWRSYMAGKRNISLTIDSRNNC